jgi:hypothetical protein
MPTLAERCQKIYSEKGIEQNKIDWLISCLAPEAIANNDLITDEQIERGKNHLLWYGLGDALLNYCAWEHEQI